MSHRSRTRLFPVWEKRHRRLREEALSLSLMGIPKSMWPPSVAERYRHPTYIHAHGLDLEDSRGDGSPRVARIIRAWRDIQRAKRAEEKANGR